MARPTKKGLDYFPFDCDFFEDEKIVAIAGEFGIKGELAVIKLLCAIYRNGYFIEWSEMLRLKILRQLPGVSVELFDQILNRLFRWGFFDASLFESVKVLTSVGIQRRYFEATKWRTESSEWPYLLLKDKPQRYTKQEKKRTGKENVEEKGELNLLSSFPKENPSFPKENPSFPKENTTNKIKQNEIKQKETPPPIEVVGDGDLGGVDWKNQIFNLVNDRIWAEATCMNLRLEINKLPELLHKFINHIISIGEESTVQELKDAKRRFTYWMSSQKNKNTTDNENNQTDRFSRRRGTESSAKSYKGFNSTL